MKKEVSLLDTLLIFSYTNKRLFYWTVSHDCTAVRSDQVAVAVISDPLAVLRK